MYYAINKEMDLLRVPLLKKRNIDLYFKKKTYTPLTHTHTSMKGEVGPPQSKRALEAVSNLNTKNVWKREKIEKRNFY